MWRISKNRSWYWFNWKCFPRVDTKHKIIFKLSFFIFSSIILLSEKKKGACSCLPSKDSLSYSFIFIQRMVSLMVILFSTKCFLFVYMYIDLLKLEAYKLFKNSEADLSWLLFKRSQLVLKEHRSIIKRCFPLRGSTKKFSTVSRKLSYNWHRRYSTGWKYNGADQQSWTTRLARPFQKWS